MKLNKLLTLFFIFTSCEGDILFRPNPCEDGFERRKGSCSAVEKSQLQTNCVDPDVGSVLKGTEITKCDGSLLIGTYVPATSYSVCKVDGEKDCIAKDNYKVVDTSKISSADIMYGKTFAGISGAKRLIKQCRNAANLSYYDQSVTSETKKLPNRVNSFPGGNAIQLDFNHGLVLDDPVQIYCAGGTGTSLGGGVVVVNTTYYAIPTTANRIQFQSTPSGGALSVTGIGGCTGNWVVSSPKDGVAQDIETLDDLNGFTSATSAPSNSPWGADYICNESNFTNVTGAAPLAPSNTIPTNASQTWSQIWRDELTGMLITNMLYDGLPNNAYWWSLNAMCKSLDSLNNGSGGTGWRLPTQKEMMQLYIDGFSRVAISGITTTFDSWTSTLKSADATQFRIFNHGIGWSYTYYGTGYSTAAFCVRSS